MTLDATRPTDDLTKQELLHAIAFFIERQSLVAQAITDFGLNPTEIGTYGPGAWAWNPQNSISELRRELEAVTRPDLSNRYAAGLRAHELRIPQQGIWHDQDGQAWVYYFHGVGCQIKNVLTQEVIDWDCPNSAAFDPFFFEEHLMWQLNNGRSPYELAQLRTWMARGHSVQQLIEQLVDEGYITKDMTLAERK